MSEQAGDAPIAQAAPAAPSAALATYARQLRPALVGLVLLTLITGGVYPAIIYGVGRLAFPDQADGSLVRRGGVVAALSRAAAASSIELNTNGGDIYSSCTGRARERGPGALRAADRCGRRRVLS